MIKLAIPFLLTDINQIPYDFVKKHNLLLEGNIFNGNDLLHEYNWEIIEGNIKLINQQLPNRLFSIHFPTDNADYLNSKINRQMLHRFIDLAIKYKILVVVLHSNYIQTLSEFSVGDLSKTRDKFLLFFQKLNYSIRDKNIIICIENMPVIGNNGDDFDSVFIFPEDFSKFNFSKIKVVWDLGHWFFTYKSLQLLKNYSTRVRVDEVKVSDFFKIQNLIYHMQFSSFKGFTFPQTDSICKEGETPKKGIVEEKLITEILQKINVQFKDMTMTLEIKDTDYTDRQNLYSTIRWIKKNI